MGSNTHQFLAESHIGSSRNTLKNDLTDKISYDDPRVFARLRISQVNDVFTTTCATAFINANRADVDLMKQLGAQASGKKNEDLEREEIQDKAGDPRKEDKSGNHGSLEERKMYDPLVRLCSYITNFGHGTDSSHRNFQRTSGMLKAEEPHTFGFPSASPDLTLTSTGADTSTSRKWCHRDAFGEVKASNNQGPKPSKAGTIPEIATQSANYARLFMSSRPFMLFCVGLQIFGTKFSVGIFDRDGITFSCVYDMFEHAEIFIRVIRSLTCNLSIKDLGEDPTIRVLSDAETQKLTGTPLGSYPSAVVSPVGNDPRYWCTIGHPIWTSLSLLGRGTNVWRVREYKGGDEPSLGRKVLIMKTAWRSCGRIPESDIYMSIEEPPQGLAEFECGGDVMFRGFPITVENLRSSTLQFPDGHPETPVLHRLLLRTVGTPMWEYTSELDLLMGFADAIRAHQNLYERGLLHRDISAGNILMAVDRESPFRGFITDLEFARIESSSIKKPQRTVTTAVKPQNKYNDGGHVVCITEATTRTHIKFESTIAVKRGAGITGTVQFMAWVILTHKQPDPFTHLATHDLESFIWVFLYCLWRNVYHRAKPSAPPAEWEEFRTLFKAMFGQVSLPLVALARGSHAPALNFPRTLPVLTANCISKALVKVIYGLRSLVHKSHDFDDAIPLTHESLLGVFNDGIASLP